jgi:hypothetical protein
MKRFLSVISFLLFIIYSSPGQTGQNNLEKYWRYRERLKRHFVVVSDESDEGTNIPAVYVSTNSDGNKNYIGWNDGNVNLSHYLGMLATEYRLLKNKGQNYQQTVDELYYAISALKRLDVRSESYFRSDHLVKVMEDANGWMIRDDVTPAFWENYRSQLGFPGLGEGSYQSVFKDGCKKDEIVPKESMSQDYVYHMLEGLALVAKLVDGEYVTSEGFKDIPALARDMSTKMIRALQHDEPIYLLHSGSNFNCVATKPTRWQIIFSPAWAALTETQYLMMCSLKSRWYIQNPVTGELAAEGSGSEFDTWLYYCYGAARAGEKISPGVNLQFTPSSRQLQEEVFMSLVDGSYKNEIGAIFQPFEETIVRGIDQWISENTGLPLGALSVDVIGDIKTHFINEIIKDFDVYKQRSLAVIGGIGGENTFWKLRNDITKYGHFLPMYMLLQGTSSSYVSTSPAYIADKNYYESLLSVAPCQGPRSYRVNDHDDFNEEWSSMSRLVWPESRNKWKDQRLDFNGLDYMLLHNLYCLAYNQDFTKMTVASNEIIRTGLEETAVDIISGANIAAYSTVNFNASHSIKFVPGFKATYGTILTAEITPTSVNYAGFSQLNTCNNITTVGRLASSQDENSTNVSSDEINSSDSDNNNTSHEAFSLYPNPNKGSIVIRINDNESMKGVGHMRILDITGQVVLERSIDQNEITVTMPESAKGFFVVQIFTNGKIHTRKIRVE